jgi:hypothetical protein
MTKVNIQKDSEAHYLTVTFNGHKSCGTEVLVELQRLDIDEALPGGKVLRFRFDAGALSSVEAGKVWVHATLLFGTKYERMAVWDPSFSGYFVLNKVGFGGVFYARR